MTQETLDKLIFEIDELAKEALYKEYPYRERHSDQYECERVVYYALTKNTNLRNLIEKAVIESAEQIREDEN